MNPMLCKILRGGQSPKSSGLPLLIATGSCSPLENTLHGDEGNPIMCRTGQACWDMEIMSQEQERKKRGVFYLKR